MTKREFVRIRWELLGKFQAPYHLDTRHKLTIALCNKYLTGEYYEKI